MTWINRCSRRRLSQALIVVFGVALWGSISSCTDNATKLSLAIETAVASSEQNRQGDHRIVYGPKTNSDLPYYIIFFPDHTVSQTALEIAGVPSKLAARIYTELAYVGVGETPLLVVAQEKERLHFTTHWTRFALVNQLLVIQAEGPTALSLRETPGGTFVVGAHSEDAEPR